MIEFLSSIHVHSEGEELNEISKTKSIRMLPLLCGVASSDKGDGQKIVNKLMAEISTQSSNRKPDFYLKFLQVGNRNDMDLRKSS